MKIGRVDTAEKVYVIAEIGGNHNGNPENAYKMVEAAAKAGADGVKFQTYDSGKLVHPKVEPVPIVRKFYATQLERFKSLELSWDVYERVFAICAGFGIDYLTTPFDREILALMAPHMPFIKIASGDLTYHDLIRDAAATGKPVVLSTGMSVPEDIDPVTRLMPADQLALLHCAAVYPLPDDQANLLAIPTMAARWPQHVIGYSDHTVGIDACLGAVALGARIIEKHFTLDKSQVPGDHRLSADPANLTDMVTRIRRLEAMRGNGRKELAQGEENMRRQMRRGLYAACDLPAGHVLTAADLTVIRPTTAFAPYDLPSLVGRRLSQSLAALDDLRPDHLAD
jgi:sialic acid synthase SpsE